jgi:hypothetical protein
MNSAIEQDLGFLVVTIDCLNGSDGMMAIQLG